MEPKRTVLMISSDRFIWCRWLFHLRSIIRQQFKSRESAIEFLYQRLNAFAAKSVYESAVVPKSALFTGIESRPEPFSFLTIIHQDRPHVVQFV